ncbi:MAG: FoF1 ATP synthase subunit a [Patescibacteria group bacterium]|jgi:F-type H+-transporting ATPase subunit a
MSQETSNNQEVLDNINNSLEEEVEVTGEHEEHEHTLFAENLFSIGNFNITNSLLTSWVAVFLIIILAIVIRIKNSKIPSRFQSFIETVIEGAYNMMDMVTDNRSKSERIFPIIFSVFIFVLINNWLGLFPGLGSITYNGTALLRGATADLNTTLALGLFGVVAANIFGIIVVGGWSWFNKFINLQALIEIPRKIRKEPTIVLINPITFFVGLVEIISEVAKIASLSFRLFGNVFAGEVLLASLSAMVAYGLPLPFMFLELIVGIIQALIFSILTLVYFTIASAEHEH